ncbi:MAG: hypothetical protein ACFHX7_25365 [Pseudomonadota bacterium]
MHRKNCLVGISLLIGASLVPPASAHEYLCRNGGMTRTIAVQHEIEGQEVPCVVRYDKPAEGKTEFPWNARTEPGYCAAKADYLATRLGSFGWQCERTDENPE